MFSSFWSHRIRPAIVLVVLLSATQSFSLVVAQDTIPNPTEQFFKEALAKRNAAIEKARAEMAKREAEAAVKQPTANQAAINGSANQFVQTGEARDLRFTFDRTPWRDVIGWLAEEGELALHVNDVPTGSFTYSDPGSFTHQEALNRVNLFLLPQGYSLVRSGKLLTVINLSDKRSMQQLDAIANLITVDQLKDRMDFDVVKCIFPLGEIKAEEASSELSVLNLMTNPVILTKTNQLMITDTVSKLKNAKVVLDAFNPEEMDNGTVVKNFALKHVKAEDILLVARPHMGLATGEMIGIDVSLSADLEGENIFATGVADKIKLLETLVESLDIEKKTITSSGENVLQSHNVEGGNVKTVYNVLLTLLADQEVRLSMDDEAGSIVAFASPAVQKEIAETVSQLQASEADFEVIPLKTADPYFVISLLEEMLDLPDSLTDPDDIDPDTPKIDADPGNMRLFVRAKKAQIEQIKKIVAGLDSSSADSASSNDEVRVIPLKGDEAKRVLETASKFWRSANPIILLSSAEAEAPANERVLVEEETTTQESTSPSRQLNDVAIGTERVLTSNANTRAPAIRCQITVRGLLVACEDTAALDRFEEHLRTIAGPLESMPSPPVVFYLKYTKSSDALTMLAELLDGGESAREGEAGTLVNGFVSASSSGFLGSFVTSRDGTTTMMSGSITVVADTRLNRLIAQGTSSDIERIEGYLKIIDKDNSITAIETFGTSHVIELANARASEVAEVLRQAFAGRVDGGDSKSAAKGTPEQQRAAAIAAAKAAAAQKAAEKKAPKGSTGGGSKSKDLTPKMTIAVHEPSNALIITAPDQLFKEAEKLAMTIDARAKQEIEILSPMNGEIYEAVLLQMMGQEPPARPSTNRSNSSSRSTSSRNSSKSGR